MQTAPAGAGDAFSAALPSAAFDRGLALHQAGDLDGAAGIYASLLQGAPTHADAWHLLGVIDLQRGSPEAGVEKIRHAIGFKRTDPRYFYNLGSGLLEIGEHLDAAEQFEKAIALNPDYAEAHGNLGAARHRSGNFSAAIASYRRAVALTPLDFKAVSNLGVALKEHGEVFEAEAMQRRAIELNPSHPDAHFSLGDLLFLQSRVDGAIDCYRRALALKPDFAGAHSSLLLFLQYSAAITPDATSLEYRRFSDRFERPLMSGWTAHDNNRDPERRLKIGYVSADLYNHAVATFIEPILEEHDREAFEIFCYYNNSKNDLVSARLQMLCDHWIPCNDLSDEQLDARIRADAIDILIDLSGHTLGNRLLTFARKPAPVQASWIGCPGTTGLAAIDYFLADRFYLPVGLIDDQFTEKIVRMPAVSGFQPYLAAPEVNPLPGLSDGVLTFGSFNQLHKFSEDVIRVWSSLLHALPTSRMLLGGLPTGEKRDGLIALFAAQGISAERLHFHDRCPLDTYMALHHQVDICLDTFPYSGGTTNVHAAWMGVPTLTMAGKSAAGRQGCVLHGHIGLDAFVATDAQDFLRRGRYWSEHLEELAAIRAGLRQKFLKSALGQPEVVIAGLEKALRQMWRRWSTGLPPQSFDVTI